MQVLRGPEGCRRLVLPGFSESRHRKVARLSALLSIYANSYIRAGNSIRLAVSEVKFAVLKEICSFSLLSKPPPGPTQTPVRRNGAVSSRV